MKIKVSKQNDQISKGNLSAETINMVTEMTKMHLEAQKQ